MSCSINLFLEHFLKNHREDSFSSLKYGNYMITAEEAHGEIVDWTLQYLQYMSCPPTFELGITKAVLDTTKSNFIRDSSLGQSFASLTLLQSATQTVNQVCQRLVSDASFRKSVLEPCVVKETSVKSIRNTRKKMEDRHVIIHDLSRVFTTSSNKKCSFYAVYDGHNGTDAASYSSSHLHEYILKSNNFPTSPVLAIYDAFKSMDEAFLTKGKKTLSSGTTAVCAFIHGSNLYVAWLGDSQAVLVRNSQVVKITDPHKPDRADEKVRITDLGGSVILYGVWRINGQLSVSRAIGDNSYKPFVSSVPDVTTIQLTDEDDFIILACDGLWDTVSMEDATNEVYKYLLEHEDLTNVSQTLVNFAKLAGSTDNITVIVVFFKSLSDLKAGYNRDKIENLYQGIESTCKYVSSAMCDQVDNGLRETSEVFNSPGGGGMTFGAPFTPSNTQSGDDEIFRRASDSIFKDTEKNEFVVNTGNSSSPPSLVLQKNDVSHKNSGEEEEELLESQQVTKLLGGKSIQDLLEYSPISPTDDTGSSLEEILASARSQPETELLEDSDESSSSSVEMSKPEADVKREDDESDEDDFTFISKESPVLGESSQGMTPGCDEGQKASSFVEVIYPSEHQQSSSSILENETEVASNGAPEQDFILKTNSELSLEKNNNKDHTEITINGYDVNSSPSMETETISQNSPEKIEEDVIEDEIKFLTTSELSSENKKESGDDITTSLGDSSSLQESTPSIAIVEENNKNVDKNMNGEKKLSGSSSNGGGVSQKKKKNTEFPAIAVISPTPSKVVGLKKNETSALGSKKPLTSSSTSQPTKKATGTRSTVQSKPMGCAPLRRPTKPLEVKKFSSSSNSKAASPEELLSEIKTGNRPRNPTHRVAPTPTTSRAVSAPSSKLSSTMINNNNTTTTSTSSRVVSNSARSKPLIAPRPTATSVARASRPNPSSLTTKQQPLLRNVPRTSSLEGQKSSAKTTTTTTTTNGVVKNGEIAKS